MSTELPKEYFYGWDLLLKSVEDQVVKKADILIALAHFLLTKHCNFRCIGIGDDKSLSDEDEGNELLPDDWNADDTRYCLRYKYKNSLYFMIGNITGDSLLINILDDKSKKTSNVCILESKVSSLKGNLAAILPEAPEIVNRFRTELLDPIITDNSHEESKPTKEKEKPPESKPNSSQPRYDPLQVGPPMRPRMPVMPYGIPEYGRGDLDPFYGGRGNLFSIPQNPRPLMRFDPFGPSGTRFGHEPNPDHLQPRGWDYDYYM